MFVVYKIVNVTNQKFYVGSTIDARVRFQTHRRQLRSGKHHCKHLQAAWNKYGEDCFKFEIVAEVIGEMEALRLAEDGWLRKFFGTDVCYNSTPSATESWRGASGEDHPAFGTKRSEETKAQMREAIKAWCAANPDKVAKGETHYRYGKVLDAETRKKIGDTQRGVKKGPRVISDEGRAKIAAAAAAGHYGHCKGRKRPQSEFVNLVRGCVELTSGKEFFSLTAALQEYGLKMPTLHRALKSGEAISKGPNAGLRFAYLTPLQNPATLAAPKPSFS
jgi:group I intron endonuclease